MSQAARGMTLAPLACQNNKPCFSATSTPEDRKMHIANKSSPTGKSAYLPCRWSSESVLSMMILIHMWSWKHQGPWGKGNKERVSHPQVQGQEQTPQPTSFFHQKSEPSILKFEILSDNFKQQLGFEVGTWRKKKRELISLCLLHVPLRSCFK